MAGILLAPKNPYIYIFYRYIKYWQCPQFRRNFFIDLSFEMKSSLRTLQCGKKLCCKHEESTYTHTRTGELIKMCNESTVGKDHVLTTMYACIR